mgnify:FL=1|jgi:hypothetical protein
MRLKTLVIAFLALTISGCSLLGPKEVEIITKPVKIDIVQPTLPRGINLKEPKWYVVSDAKVIENCLKNPETKEPDCKLGREDRYPEGYTHMDKFIDAMRKQHGGDVVFVAMTVEDYELMAYNTQEIKRYISQLGEVIVYYRNVTIGDDNAGAVEIKVEENE